MKKSDNAYNLLADAYRSFQKKRYNEAYVILEQIVVSKPDDPYPYFLLAVIYLFSNKFDKARNVIDGIVPRFRDYMPVIHLEAFLNMKAAVSFEAALAYYISRIKEYPADRMLLKTVSAMRQASDFKVFQREALLQDFVEISAPQAELSVSEVSDRKNDFVQKRQRKPAGRRRGGFRPVFSFKIPRKVFVIVSACILISVSVFIAVSITSGVKPIGADAALLIDGAEISGPSSGLINTITREKTKEFYATTAALLADYNSARQLMKKGEHNKAVPLLNKISESNAAFAVKEKAAFLISFILSADERKYENISFDELSKHPWLYRGYSLEWDGKIANLKKGKSSRSFTMLINYKDGDIFSGTASIFYDSEKPELSNGSKIRMRGIFMNLTGGGLPDIKAREIEIL